MNRNRRFSIKTFVPHWRAPATFLCLLSSVLVLLGVPATSAKRPDDLNSRAGSVLSQKCLKCHDSAKRSGGLDLSRRATAASFLGTVTASRVLRAVNEGRMPPSGKLPEDELVLLRRWVASGAAYPAPKIEEETAMSPTLWSFQPVRRPAVPTSSFDRLAVNAIDRFVFQMLQEKGLKPSGPADRLTLIRRVTVDLTGLPPSPTEVDAFISDRSPGAYEKVVDRLLASPAYGERWGRHWLDVVRFGESNGYEQNHLRPNAWPYRDYVIHSFNADKPYDRFVMEQLAGDVLAKDDSSANAGTGFLVAGVHDTVGIQEEEGTRQQRINDIEDIVSTTGAAFLGLTVGCARCHDHKFDPIPQRDFYRLAAVFAGVRHGERPLEPGGTPASDQKEIADLERQIATQTDRINEIDGRARAIILGSRDPKSSRPAVTARRNEDTFGPAQAKYVRFTVLATKDGTEPCLDELQVFGPAGGDNLALSSRGSLATASGLLPGFAIHQVAHLNDGQFGNEHSWISAERGSGWAQVELAEVATINRVVWSRDGGEIPRFDDRLPSRYRIEISIDGREWKTVSTEEGRAGGGDYIHPDELSKALSTDDRKRRDRATADLSSLKQKLSDVRNRGTAYIGTFSAPDPTFVLRRGDVMQRQEQVQPGGLSKVTCLASDLLRDDNQPEPDRRLALARWIIDKHNPLTPRVMVNRIWQHHFNRGIVGTSSDFGRNGERPTHPELLDWLADDFMANGWKMKRLHKMMVMSYTYRQSNGARPDAIAKDAGNLFLWRMPLIRMEAEAVRDAILQASGKLDRRMGGPGYKLYQYSVLNVGIFQPREEYGPDTWRRGVYSQAARGIRDSLMGTLDCPECSQRAPKRESTTTPLQALSLLNGTFVQQQAGFLAERVRGEAGADKKLQVKEAFRLAFGRRPTTDELSSSMKLLNDVGLNSLCRALMNANEFLYY